MEIKILDEVENFIYNYYKDHAPSSNVYHNLTHVKNVVKFVEEIGRNSGLSAGTV